MSIGSEADAIHTFDEVTVTFSPEVKDGTPGTNVTFSQAEGYNVQIWTNAPAALEARLTEYVDVFRNRVIPSFQKTASKSFSPSHHGNAH